LAAGVITSKYRCGGKNKYENKIKLKARVNVPYELKL
jgi:hypothetical protein